MKYCLRIFKNKNLFKRRKSFPKCIEHQIFLDPQLQPLGLIWVSVNYPILNFKKTVYPKIVWMRLFSA